MLCVCMVWGRKGTVGWFHYSLFLLNKIAPVYLFAKSDHKF